MSGFMNTVFINGKFLAQKTTGVQRYARSIVQELDRLPSAKDQYVLICPSDSDPTYRLQNIPVVILKGKASYVWEQARLARYVRKRNGYLLNLCNVCPIALRDRNFSTIHDVAYIDNKSAYNWKFRLVYRFLQKRNAKHSAILFTDSQFSKERLLALYPIKAEKIRVVYCGAPSLSSSSEEHSSLAPSSKPFYFSVGSASPNKNFAYLYEAAKANPDFDFLIAGGAGKAFASLSDTDKPTNLRFLGYLSDSDLHWYYRHCEALIFPSFYEGFGLPPLEAVAYGCSKLILSNIPVLKEIYEGYANFVDPSSFDAVSFQASSLRLDKEKRTQLLSRFSWSDSAQKINGAISDYLQNK
jgi:glycosyltransferase involved in cell wall biosynthesis